MPIKVVVNTIPLLKPATGVGWYIYNLCHEFLHLSPSEFSFYFYYGWFSRKIYMPSSKVSSTNFFLKPFKVLLRRLSRYASFFSSNHFDLYFEPNFIPLSFKARSIVVTVHDFSFIRYPNWHPKERIAYFNNNFFKNIYKADAIVTPSEFIAEEVKQFIPDFTGKVKPIHLACDTSVFNTQAASGFEKFFSSFPEKYILFVGTIEPRKNLSTLLKAYSLLPSYLRKEYPIVIVGAGGWKNSSIKEQLKVFIERGEAIHLGYVPIKLLAALYTKAYCLVYPSFYEGFGLPPLEAMSCGCPVIVSNVASLPEVCGDAALYIDPTQVEELASTLFKLLSSVKLRNFLSSKALLRASMFSWEKAAKNHLSLFSSLLLDKKLK